MKLRFLHLLMLLFASSIAFSQDQPQATGEQPETDQATQEEGYKPLEMFVGDLKAEITPYVKDFEVDDYVLDEATGKYTLEKKTIQDIVLSFRIYMITNEGQKVYLEPLAGNYRPTPPSNENK